MLVKSRVFFIFVATSLILFSSSAMGGEEAAEEAAEESTTASSTATATASGGAQVIEARTASGVEEREPVDVSDTFSANDTVTLWMAVRSAEGPTNLDVVWSVNGNEIHTYNIEVGQSWRWRTWAQMRVARAGDWNVEIRDGNGTALETVAFTVTE